MKKNFDHSFLKDFVKDKEIIHDPESKSTVRHDHWDEQNLQAILEEMAEFSGAQDELGEFTPTGRSAMGDLWYSVVKAVPQLKDSNQVRPSHLVNRAVEGEMMGMPEWAELRDYCVGDVVGAAISCVSMEPTMEVLFDRVKEEQKMADQLEEMLEQQFDLEQQDADIAAMIENAMKGDQEDKSAQVKDLQAQQELIKEALKKLQEGTEKQAKSLEEALDGKALAMRMALRDMLNDGMKDVQYTSEIAKMWGLEEGVLYKMNPSERMELAKKINTPHFQKIVDIFGPARNLAFAEQERKTTHSHEEVYDIARGNDLSRVIPVELLTIHHPVLMFDFFRKFNAGELLQYELKGTEPVMRGGIIMCIDGSGSMSGEPEVWAKGMALATLHVARKQGRSFYGIHFGSVNELARFDFRDTNDINVEKVMDFASHFFCGGTDFHTPLSAAVDILQEEYNSLGYVTGDIVFVTDGECGVSEEWLKEFKEKQEELGFRVFGIAINTSDRAEPLATICDGRVFTVQNMLNATEIRDIFREL